MTADEGNGLCFLLICRYFLTLYDFLRLFCRFCAAWYLDAVIHIEMLDGTVIYKTKNIGAIAGCFMVEISIFAMCAEIDKKMR